MLLHRFRVVSLLLIAAFLAAPLCFTGGVRAEEKKKKTELNKKMEVMDEGMKKLKRTLRRPADDAQSLKVIAQVIEAATAARDMVPAKAASMPQADRKKFIDEYQKGMTQLIATMGQMKDAVTAGDNKKAMALHKSLKTQEEDGHDKFMESDDKPDDKNEK
ncbi:MAG TPA: cytochrome b562 [Tepidisphaeraceae bacterium]|nr:cytochrome b562 [Tepidisphaeraceae bacterium]